MGLERHTDPHKKVLKYLQMLLKVHLQFKVNFTLGAGGIDWTGSFLAACFKGVSVAQRSTRQACRFLAGWSFLCQLFALDWPSFRWGWFNNIELVQWSILQFDYFQQFFVCEEELSKALQLASDFKLKIDEEEAMKQDILSELLSERTTKANKLLLEQGRNKEVIVVDSFCNRSLSQNGR